MEKTKHKSGKRALKPRKEAGGETNTKMKLGKEAGATKNEDVKVAGNATKRNREDKKKSGKDAGNGKTNWVKKPARKNKGAKRSREDKGRVKKLGRKRLLGSKEYKTKPLLSQTKIKILLGTRNRNESKINRAGDVCGS